jgi:hypothetical protein
VVDGVGGARTVASCGEGDEGTIEQCGCGGHGLASSSSTSAWHGWDGGQKHIRSWPANSRNSAARGEAGSHCRYSRTAVSASGTPGVPIANGLPHLCGRATEMAPSGLRQPLMRRAEHA